LLLRLTPTLLLLQQCFVRQRRAGFCGFPPVQNQEGRGTCVCGWAGECKRPLWPTGLLGNGVGLLEDGGCWGKLIGGLARSARSGSAS
jgi:hypothetical protein